MNRKIVWIAGLLLSSVLLGQGTEPGLSLGEARNLLSKGMNKEAVETLRRAVRRFPENPELRTELATALGRLAGNAANSGDYGEAMARSTEAFAELDTAITLDPNRFDGYFIYGVFSVNVPAFMGRLEPGVGHMEKAGALAEAGSAAVPVEQKAALYRYLGQGYRMLGRTADAETAWNRVLFLAPAGADADAARQGLQAIRDEKAEPGNRNGTNAGASGVVAPGPAASGPAALIERGKSLLSKKQWTEAAAPLREAVGLDSLNGEAYILLARALEEEATAGYDERIYKDQRWRTNLAFEVTRTFEKAHRLLPGNPEITLHYALMCVQMPFFVGKADEGLSILAAMSKDAGLPDSIRNEATYQYGFGLRKKGRGVWADFVKNNPDAEQASQVYREYGLRENSSKLKAGERVQVQFHLGFQDELEPQTGLWIEDADGKFVKTLYVSGFSGFAKEKQVVLPEFAKRTKFETDGNTGASIDWGKTMFDWDLTGPSGKRVKPGVYNVRLEVSWWPSMRYETAEAKIRVGGKGSETTVSMDPLIPRLQVRYLPK